MLLKKRERALKYFREILSLADGQFKTDPGGTLKLLNRALTLSPDNETLKVKLSEYYFILHDWKKSKKLADEIKDQMSRDHQEH